MHGASFLNRCTVITDLDTSKRSIQKAFFLVWRHLGNWPRSNHKKRTAGTARETWTFAAADGVRCARVRWEINFLLTFETAPFFCVYPVYCGMNNHDVDSCTIDTTSLRHKILENLRIKRRNKVQQGHLAFKILPVSWCTSSLTFNNCTFCPHRIYVFCIYLRTNSDLCQLQHKLIEFYNWEEKCLLRGTNWVFK